MPLALQIILKDISEIKVIPSGIFEVLGRIKNTEGSKYVGK